MRTSARWLFLTGLTIPIALAAQEVEPIFDYACAQGAGSGCDGECDFDWKPHYEQLSRLHDLQGGVDFKTVLLTDFPLGIEPQLDQMKETWYVRKGSLSGQTGGLYRCLNAAIPDQRDSASVTEGTPSYNCYTPRGAPFVQGNPWSLEALLSRTPVGASTSALQPLRRYVKTGGNDFRTWTSQTPAGYTPSVTFNGTSTPARLGYERFGNLLDKRRIVGPDGFAGYSTYYLDNGFMRVDFNKIWGNAIGRITQLGTGRQIVSEPVGDMVQSVLRFASGDPDCRIPNPTQSGGAACGGTKYGNTKRWAGSPVVQTIRAGTSPTAPQTFTSVVRPLEFCHNGTNKLTATTNTPPWRDATDTEPLLWNGFIERSDTLSCKLATALRKDVLRTTTRVALTGNNGGPASQSFGGVNTYWLSPKDLAVTRTNTAWDFQVWCEDFDHPSWSRWLIRNPSGQSIVGAQDRSCGAPPGTPPNLEGDSVPRGRHAIVASRKDGVFAYALVRLSVDSREVSNVWFRCAQIPCNNATKGILVLQALPKFDGVTKTAWSAPKESFLVMNSKPIIMSRLIELKREADAGGVNCFN